MLHGYCSDMNGTSMMAKAFVSIRDGKTYKAGMLHRGIKLDSGSLVNITLSELCRGKGLLKVVHQVKR